jgi:hypothetical protein
MTNYDPNELSNFINNIKNLNEQLYQEYEEANSKGSSPLRAGKSTNHSRGIPLSQYN